MAAAGIIIKNERNVLERPTKKRNLSKRIMRHWQLYILILPCLICAIIFKYLPMYGAQIAFRDYNATLGFSGSHWVGLKFFHDFFSSYQLPRLLKNTIGISVYQMLASLPIPIILAIGINETKWKFFGKTVQTITYAPYFISTVVMVSILFQFLSPYGLLNNLLAIVHIAPVDLMSNPALFKSIYVWSYVWQTAGYSAVIYLAALSGINCELYEAARIDGASTLQKIINIDLPGIVPTAIILLILSCGQVLNVEFAKVFLMQNPLNYDVSDVINTYIYRQGLESSQYSYSAAIGLFNSGVSFILLVGVNLISKKYSETSLF